MKKVVFAFVVISSIVTAAFARPNGSKGDFINALGGVVNAIGGAQQTRQHHVKPPPRDNFKPRPQGGFRPKQFRPAFPKTRSRPVQPAWQAPVQAVVESVQAVAEPVQDVAEPVTVEPAVAEPVTVEPVSVVSSDAKPTVSYAASPSASDGGDRSFEQFANQYAVGDSLPGRLGTYPVYWSVLAVDQIMSWVGLDKGGFVGLIVGALALGVLVALAFGLVVALMLPFDLGHHASVGWCSALAGVLCVILSFVPLGKFLDDPSKLGNADMVCICGVSLFLLISTVVSFVTCLRSPHRWAYRIVALIAYLLYSTAMALVGAFALIAVAMVVMAAIVIAIVFAVLAIGFFLLKVFLLTNPDGRYKCCKCGSRFDSKVSVCPVCGAHLAWD